MMPSRATRFSHLFTTLHPEVTPARSGWRRGGAVVSAVALTFGLTVLVPTAARAAGEPDPSLSTVVMSAATVTPGETIAGTVTVLDSSGQPVANQEVDLNLSIPLASTDTTMPYTTDANGQVSVSEPVPTTENGIPLSGLLGLIGGSAPAYAHVTVNGDDVSGSPVEVTIVTSNPAASTGAISGGVYLDNDSSNTWTSGDASVDGATVTLTTCTDPATTVKTTTAGKAGAANSGSQYIGGIFTFYGLNPGCYLLHVASPSSDVVPNSDKGSQQINVTAGSFLSGTNVGFAAPPAAPAVGAVSVAVSPDSATIGVPTCGGASVATPSSVAATVTVKDTAGKPMAGQAVVVTADAPLTVPSGALTTGADGTVQVSLGVDSSSLSPTGTSSASVRATVGDASGSTPVAVTRLGMVMPAMQSLALASSPTAGSPVIADGSASWTVSATMVDQCGGLMSGWPVNFSVGGAAKLSSASATTDSNGVATVTVTDMTAETVQVSADGATSGPASLVFAPVPAPVPSQTPLQCLIGGKTVTTNTVMADPNSATVGSTVDLSAYVTDANCQPIEGATVTLYTTTGSGAIAGDGQATTDANGLATASLTDTVAETVHVSGYVSATGGGAQFTGADVAFNPGAAAVGGTCTSGAGGTPSYLQADASSPVGKWATVEVMVSDQFCNLVADGAQVTLTVSSPSGNASIVNTGSLVTWSPLSATAATTNGQAIAYVTDTTVETVNVVATVVVKGAPSAVPNINPPPAASADVAFVPDVVDSASSTFTVSPTASDGSDVPFANGNSTGSDYWTGTVTVKDADGVLLPDLTPTDFTFSPNSADVKVSTPPVNNHDGTYTVTFTSIVADSTNTVYANYQGSAIAGGTPLPIPFKPLPATVIGAVSVAVSPDSATITTPACGGAASASPGSVTATVSVTDTTGAPMAGQDVTLTADAPLTVPSGTFTTGSDGTVQVALGVDASNPGAGSATVRAAVGAVSGSAAEMIVVPVVPLVPPTVTLTASPASGTTVVANGHESYTVTATVVDGCGNKAADMPVGFSVGGDAVLSAVSAVTDSDGVASVTVTDATAETATITATISFNPAATKSIDVTFSAPNPNPPCANLNPPDLAFSVSPVVSTSDQSGWPAADGVASYTGTVTASGVSDGCHLVYGPGAGDFTFTASSPDVKVSGVTDNGDGTFTATFTSTVAGADFTASAGYSGYPNGGVAVPVGEALPIPFAPPTPVVGAVSVSLSPDSVTITTPACGGAATASPSSVMATVSVTDTTGAPMAGQTVTLTADPRLTVPSGTFTTGSDGTVQVTLGVDASNPGGGPATVQAAVGDVSGSATEMMVPAVLPPTPPTVTLAVAPASGTAVSADGQGSYTVTATVVDGCGNVAAGTPVSFRVVGDAVLSSDSAVTDSNGVATVTVTDTTVETANVSATVDGVTSGAAALVFSPVPEFNVITLSVSADPVQVPIPCGSSGTVPQSTVTAVVSQTLIPPGGPLPVTFSVSSGSGHATITGPSTVATDSSGKASIVVTDLMAESVTVTATVDGAAPQSVVLTFVPGCVAPPVTDFSAASSTFAVTDVGVKGCYSGQEGPFIGTLTARDAQGNLLTDLDPSLVSFTASSPDVTVSSVTNNGDGTYSATFSASLGTSFSASVTYDGSAKVADSSGVTDPLFFFGWYTADPSVSASAVAVTVDRSQVSVGQSATVTVAYGPVGQCDPGAVTVMFAASSGGAIVPTDPTAATVQSDGTILATIQAGGSASVAVSSSSARVVPVDVQYLGFGGWYTAIGSPMQIAFTSAPTALTYGLTVLPVGDPSDPSTAVQAGGSYTATVTVKDANGQPVAGAVDASQVVFTPSSAYVTVSGVTDNHDGTYTALLTSKVADTRMGTGNAFTVWATVDGVPAVAPDGGAVLPIPFRAGPPSVGPFDCQTSGRSSGLVVSTSSGATMLEPVFVYGIVTDQYCNPVPGVLVTISVPSPATATMWNDPTTDKDGFTTAVIEDSIAQTVPVTATIQIDGVDTLLPPGAVDVAFDDCCATQPTARFTVTPTADTSDNSTWPIANGVSAYTGTVTVTDTNGDPMPGLDVTDFGFVVSDSAVKVSAVTDNGDGTYSAKFTSLVAGAAYTVYATYQYGSVPASGFPWWRVPIPFGAGPSLPEPGLELLVAPPTNLSDQSSWVATGGFYTITMTPHGSGLAASDITISPSSTYLSIGAVADNGDGTFSAKVTSSVAGSYYTVTASAPGFTTYTLQGDGGSLLPIPFKAPAPVPWRFTSFMVTPGVTTSDQSNWVVADGVASYTGVVTAEDANGNPVPGLNTKDITFSSSSADVKMSDVTDNGDGTYSVQFTSTVADASDSVYANYQGDAIVGGAALPIPFAPGAPVAGPLTCAGGVPGTSLSVSPASPLVGQSTIVTALVTDANCNPVPGVMVWFGEVHGSQFKPSDGVVTNAAGMASQEETNYSSGTVTMSAVVGSATGPTAPVVGSADITWASVPSASLTYDAASNVATVTVLDGFGNPLPGANVTFSFVAGFGSTWEGSTSPDGSLTVTTGVDGVATAQADISPYTGGGCVIPTILVSATAAFDGASVPVSGSPVMVPMTYAPAAAPTASGCEPQMGVFSVSPVADASDRSTWVAAGGSYTATFVELDSNGNPVTGLDPSQIVFTPSSGNVTVGAVTDNGDGTYSATLTATVADPSYTVSVKYGDAVVPSASGDSSLPIPFKAGPPVASIQGATLTYDSATNVATVTLMASQTDVVLPMPPATVTFDAGNGAVTVATNAQGVATTNVTPPAYVCGTTVSWHITASVTLDGTGAAVPVTGSPLNLTVTPPAGACGASVFSFANSTFQVSPKAAQDGSNWVTADGVQAYTGIVTAVDNFGHAMTNLNPKDFTFSSSSSAVKVSDVTNNGDGTYSVKFTSIAADATDTVYANYQGQPIGNPQPTGAVWSIPFAAGSPVAGPLTCAGGVPGTSLSASPASSAVGGKVTFTALVTDANCNPVPGVDVWFGEVVGSVFQPEHFEVTNAAGVATNTRTDNSAGTVTLSAVVGSSSGPTAPVVGTLDVTWGASSASLTFDFASGTATVTVLNSDGSPMPGAKVTFSATGGSFGSQPSTVMTNAQGVATAQVVAQLDACGVSGLASVSATVVAPDGSSIVVGGSPMVFTRPAVVCNPAMTFAITPAVSASDQSNWPVADGVSAYTGTVTVKNNTNGNPMPALNPKDFTFSASSSAVKASSVTDNGDGTYTVQFTSTVADSTDTVYASYQGSQISVPLPIPFKAVPPSPTPAQPAVPPSPTPAQPAVPVVSATNGSVISGTATPGDTVVVKDASGQPVAGCDNVTVDSTGQFSCTPASRILPGNSLTVVDVTAGGVSSVAATVTVSAMRVAISIPQVTVGQSQTITGYNFNPGERVGLTLQSTPVDMGSQIADASGTVVFTFAIPSTLEIGAHTATLTGAQSGSVSGPFNVMVFVETGGSVVPTSPSIALGVGVAYVGRKEEDGH